MLLLDQEPEATVARLARNTTATAYSTLNGLAAVKLLVQTDKKEAEDCSAEDSDDGGSTVDGHGRD